MGKLGLGALAVTLIATGCSFELELVRSQSDGGPSAPDGAAMFDGGDGPDAGQQAINPCDGTIVDHIDFTSTSPTVWEFFMYGTGTASLDSGRLRIVSGGNNSGGGIYEYNAQQFTNRAVIARLEPPADLAGHFAGLNLRLQDVEDPANLVLELNNNEVLVYHNGDQVFNGSYDPPADVFLRIADGGDATFEFATSEDGVSWTTWHTLTDGTLDADLRAALPSGSYFAETPTASTFYDDLIWCQR